MKTSSFLATAVVLAAGVAFSQEESAAEEKEPIPQAEKSQPKAAYTTLPFCRLAEGTAEVRKPGETEWIPAEEGRFYPLGSAYRTSGASSRLTIAFGPESAASISGDASFGTDVQPLGKVVRTIFVESGCVELDLARNLPEGAFVASAHGFLVKNPAGESRITCTPKGDGDEAVVRCVTGTLAVEGQHFSIPQMRAANEVRIRTSQDKLFTGLYGTSGNYVVSLNVGTLGKDVVQDDGSVKFETAEEHLDWHLSPETRVEIVRALPDIGSRMSVCVTAWDAAGEKQHERVFSEGRAEVNSGELVESKKTDSEELAKKAAEATEETTVAVEDDEKKTEDSNNE